jgi:hypothetical protein
MITERAGKEHAGEILAKNLHLYAKLGYRPFREERVSSALTLVYLEKSISPVPFSHKEA